MPRPSHIPTGHRHAHKDTCQCAVLCSALLCLSYPGALVCCLFYLVIKFGFCAVHIASKRLTLLLNISTQTLPLPQKDLHLFSGLLSGSVGPSLLPTPPHLLALSPVLALTCAAIVGQDFAYIHETVGWERWRAAAYPCSLCLASGLLLDAVFVFLSVLSPLWLNIFPTLHGNCNKRKTRARARALRA